MGPPRCVLGFAVMLAAAGPSVRLDHPRTPTARAAPMAESLAADPPPSPPGTEILVLVAHPELEQSRANKRMLAAARALQHGVAAGRLEVRDLYALYPDY